MSDKKVMVKPADGFKKFKKTEDLTLDDINYIDRCVNLVSEYEHKYKTTLTIDKIINLK